MWTGARGQSAEQAHVAHIRAEMKWTGMWWAMKEFKGFRWWKCNTQHLSPISINDTSFFLHICAVVLWWQWPVTDGSCNGLGQSSPDRYVLTSFLSLPLLSSVFTLSQRHQQSQDRQELYRGLCGTDVIKPATLEQNRDIVSVISLLTESFRCFVNL